MLAPQVPEPHVFPVSRTQWVVPAWDPDPLLRQARGTGEVLGSGEGSPDQVTHVVASEPKPTRARCLGCSVSGGRPIRRRTLWLGAECGGRR